MSGPDEGGGALQPNARPRSAKARSQWNQNTLETLGGYAWSRSSSAGNSLLASRVKPRLDAAPAVEQVCAAQVSGWSRRVGSYEGQRIVLTSALCDSISAGCARSNQTGPATNQAMVPASIQVFAAWRDSRPAKTSAATTMIAPRAAMATRAGSAPPGMDGFFLVVPFIGFPRCWAYLRAGPMPGERG